MVAMLKETEEQFGIKITFSVESEPLGTGQSNLPLSLSLMWSVG
jgi:hypothetical protein